MHSGTTYNYYKVQIYSKIGARVHHARTYQLLHALLFLTNISCRLARSTECSRSGGEWALFGVNLPCAKSML